MYRTLFMILNALASAVLLLPAVLLLVNAGSHSLDLHDEAGGIILFVAPMVIFLLLLAGLFGWNTWSLRRENKRRRGALLRAGNLLAAGMLLTGAGGLVVHALREGASETTLQLTPNGPSILFVNIPSVELFLLIPLILAGILLADSFCLRHRAAEGAA